MMYKSDVFLYVSRTSTSWSQVPNVTNHVGTKLRVYVFFFQSGFLQGAVWKVFFQKQ